METRGKLTVVAAVCALIAGLPVPDQARIIYVDDSAAGAADGTSWGNAFPYLQDALAIADRSDEIRVARGIYKPNGGVTVEPYPPGRGHDGTEIKAPPRYPPFRLKTGLTLRGGFAGGAADDPNARDVKQFETILSGDLNGDDAAGWWPGDPVYESTRTDNNRVVVESEAAVLDGLVVQSATESGLHNMDGGLRLMNCTFRWNSAAGLFCYGGQSELENCLFQENSRGSSGGGIMISGHTYRTAHGEVTFPARLTVRECRFIGNSAWTGGAICAGDCRLSLTGCSFEGNTAVTAGAVALFRGSLALTDCRFEGNLASQSGGAVGLHNQETVTMTRCLFRGNRAVGGGAISNWEGPLTLDSDIFSGNQAEFGGAIEAVVGWSTFPLGANDILIRGCVFTGNRGVESGGTIYAGPRANFTITGCTFADNWARTAGWAGSTAYRVTMDNCILWDGSESIAPSLYVSARSVERFPAVIIRYSDVRGGWQGEGNIDADPQFAGPGRWEDGSDPGATVTPDHANAVWVEGDYHLKSQAGRWDTASERWVQDAVTSPCIDAGDPTIPVGEEPQPNGGRINLGAYGGTAEAGKSLLP
jgi:predicted outer membrane repeat protein